MARPRKHSTDILQAALIGFQHMRDQLEQRITDLRRQIGEKITPAQPAASKTAAKRGSAKRGMSAAARRRISLAQKKRWAEQKAGGAKAAPKRRKRVISEAGKARIAAAAKKRWANFRKSQEAGNQ